MPSERFVTTYRLFLFLLGLGTQLYLQFESCINSLNLGCLDRNKFLTIQSNYFVIIWLGLYLLWRTNPKKQEFLNGPIKGALTVYISITFIAYSILIAPTDTYFWTFGNFSQHFFVPVLFILDFLMTNNVRYRWKHVLYWVIYPLAYLAYALMNGYGNYRLGFIYGFLNIPKLGIAEVSVVVSYIFILFFALSGIFIYYSRRRNQEITNS